MFSKELENLIQATLEDGILEDYEKAALVKRAEAEGVDLAELEIYINSILQRRKRELENEKRARSEQAEKEKREAFGRKCPNCGAQVPPLVLRCECGYEFATSNSVSSVQILSDKIQEINSKPLPKKGSEDDELKRRNSQIIDIISVFPVPNTKEDIIEFLSLAAPNSKLKGGLWGTALGRIKILTVIAVIGFILSLIFGGERRAEIGAIVIVGIAFYGGMACGLIDQDTIRHNKRAEAWKTKFSQVLMKGRSLRGDPEFTQQLDYYENLLNKK